MQQRTHHGVIGNQDPELIFEFVTRAASEDADTVYIPGTAWRALEIVEELEKRLNKTVITVNQATFGLPRFPKSSVGSLAERRGARNDIEQFCRPTRPTRLMARKN